MTSHRRPSRHRVSIFSSLPIEHRAILCGGGKLVVSEPAQCGDIYSSIYSWALCRTVAGKAPHKYVHYVAHRAPLCRHLFLLSTARTVASTVEHEYIRCNGESIDVANR